MKYKAFLFILILFLTTEIAAFIWLNNGSFDGLQDTVKVNEAVQSVQSDWDNISAHKNVTDLDYTVLDNSGTVLFKTRDGLSESINEAIVHRDTILDIKSDNALVGKIIIHNGISESITDNKKKTAAVIKRGAIKKF